MSKKCNKLTKEIINNKIIKKIDNKEIGSQFVIIDSIDSTNLKAKELARSGYKSGTIVIAEEQTAGKGRLERNWYSPQGTGLWLSIILHPDIPVINSPFLTIIASLAVLETLEDIEKGMNKNNWIEKEGLNNNKGRKISSSLEIKWPNDLLLDGKKVAGILSELSFSGKINYAIIGIGININQEYFPEELAEIATSLKIKYKKEIDRIEILKKLLISFEKHYYQLLKKKNQKLINKWKERINIIGKEVRVFDNEKTYEGVVLDISNRGELILKSKGEVLQFWAGDVSLRMS